jgi:phage terminase large subunit
VPTKEVNWAWMAAKKNSIFNKIKATCDELEMTKMMSFKYDWNEEIICQFYATFYFDVEG